MSSILIILLAVILILLYRFVRYDWQIRRLLRKQRNFDLSWGDLKRHKILSKGDHAVFRKWGVPFDGPKITTDQFERLFHRDLFAELQQDMELARRDGGGPIVSDHVYVPSEGGEKKYYRRFFHPLGKWRFMLCIQDITPQKLAEAHEQLLNELLDVLRDGLVFLDRDMNVLCCNGSVEELLPSFDPARSYCAGCLYRQPSRCTSCHLRKTFDSGRKQSRFRFVEETGRWIETTCFPVRDHETGEVNRVLEYVRDITEQHDREENLHHREDFLATILNASHDGIAAFSDDGNKMHVNARLVEMLDGCHVSLLQADSEAARQRADEIACNPESLQWAKEEHIRTNRPCEGVLRMRTGHIFEWQLVSVQIGYGKSGWLRIWTFHDLTDRIRCVEAEQAAVAKSKYLGQVSHEIREPLNTLIEAAEEILHGNPTPEQGRFVELARRSGKRLLALMNDLPDRS